MIEHILTTQPLSPRLSRLLSDAACRLCEARIARKWGDRAKARRCYARAHHFIRMARGVK
jgi:hypothetical protein